MIDFVYISVYVLAAFIAAIVAAFSVAGATHYTKGRTTGWLHHYFYVVFIYMAVVAIFSNRELTAATAEMSSEVPTGPSAITAWTSRCVSVFLIVSSLERIFSVWISQKKRTSTAAALALAFVIFWLATVASPAFLGKHTGASHDNLYPLLIGWAMIQFSAAECNAALLSARNGTLLFVLLGYLFLPFKPRLVIETGYTQGYIPGLPRFVGLAPHAVSLGLLVQIALLLLWESPYKNAWINRIAWLLCVSALFLAQSKTAWISFILSAIIMLAYRHGRGIRRRLFDTTRPEIVVALICVCLFATVAIFGAAMYGSVGHKLMSYLDSAQGNQLMTFTGRDQIWAIALDEFYANPIFGYGSTLFSLEYRMSIGMLNATHGHNQLMDTLGRSGIVGTIPMAIYFLLLMFLSIMYSKATRGLSLAIFTVLAFRCVSEVPLAITTNTHEFAAQLLLLIVLVGAAHSSQTVNVIRAGVSATPVWARGGVTA